MRVLLFVFGLAVLGAIGWLLVSWFKIQKYKWDHRRGEWQRDELTTTDGTVRVQLIHPTEPPLLVGEPLPFKDEDFDLKLVELRSEADYRLTTLNHGK